MHLNRINDDKIPSPPMPHTAGLDSKALKAVVLSHDSAQEVQAV